MAPTKVISRQKKRRVKDRNVCFHYLCDDGEEYTMEQLTSINPDLLPKWRVEVGIRKAPVIIKRAVFNRGRCKRDSQLCEKYIECQNVRLGLTEGKEWEDPGDTDKCYKELKNVEVKYPSALAAIYEITFD